MHIKLMLPIFIDLKNILRVTPDFANMNKNKLKLKNFKLSWNHSFIVNVKIFKMPFTITILTILSTKYF